MKKLWKRLQPFWIAFLSTAIYYVSLPPISLRYTIFLVPAIWAAFLVPNRLKWSPEKLDKRRGRLRRLVFAPLDFFARGEYRQLWLAACCFWLATLSWVRYPHPATTLGWIALSCYLACYLPLFVFQTRVLNRAFRVPIWLAAPFSWLAVESLRNVVFGGFSFAGLSHALYDVPKFIQIADFFGEYGVGVMIALVGSLLGCGLFPVAAATRPDGTPPKRSGGARLVSFALIVALANYLYGAAAISRFDALEAEGAAHGSRPVRLALLQCGTTYRFPVPDALTRQIENTYLALANEAADDAEGYDAIVWPEGTYPGFFVDFSYDPKTTPEPTPVKDTNDENLRPSERRYSRQWITRRMRSDRLYYANLTARLKTPALLGMASAVFDEEGKETSYNALIYAPYFGSEKESAALEPDVLEAAPRSSYDDPDPRAFRRYDKVALVIFGEYVPFAEYLPDGWSIKAACADVALGRGRGPSSYRVPARDGSRSYSIAPHICFESVVPEFVAGQLEELRKANVDPDILMNVSNDGWFRNGRETDLHLATMVFRAVENRRPLVTATHGGFSAYVDATGRVRAKGERGGTEVVDARVAIVKAHPPGLVKLRNGDELRYWNVPKTTRGLGFGVFAVSVVAGLLLKLTRRKTASNAGRSES